MRLLLDTHIALWSIADDPRLSVEARNLITEPANEILVSVASLWEIAIKHALSRLGRADMALSAQQAHQYFREAGYRMLGIGAAHAIAVEALPALHGDPFDRILVAQALTEPARLVTHDTKVAAYSDTIIATMSTSEKRSPAALSAPEAKSSLTATQLTCNFRTLNLTLFLSSAFCIIYPDRKGRLRKCYVLRVKEYLSPTQITLGKDR